MHINVNKFKHMFIIITSIIRCSLVIDSCVLVNTYSRQKKKHTYTLKGAHRHTNTQRERGIELDY